MIEQVQRGQKWLEELLSLMGVTTKVETSVVTEHDGKENGWLIIDAEQLSEVQIATLVGVHGENLDAMQYLANALLNIGVPAEVQRPLTIELNGYRVRRQAELASQIEEVTQQVRQTGEEYEMKSLSAAERRQIHNLLEDAEDLETESRGQEPNRVLVVKPK